MNWTMVKHLLQTILRARRKGLLFLKRADHSIGLECLGGDCGLCCDILGSGVTANEAEARTLGEEFIVKTGGLFILKSSGSACCLLKDKFCSRYNDRPKGCREYPWYNIDGQLYYDSGCPGITRDRDDRPAARSLNPFEKYLPGIPKMPHHQVKKTLTAE